MTSLPQHQGYFYGLFSKITWLTGNVLPYELTKTHDVIIYYINTCAITDVIHIGNPLEYGNK